MAAVKPSFHFEQPVSGKPLVIVLAVASAGCCAAVVLLILATSMERGALIGWGVLTLASSMAFTYHFKQFRKGAVRRFDLTEDGMLWSDSSLTVGVTKVSLRDVARIREEIDDADSIFVLELREEERIRLPAWLTFYPKDRARFAAYLSSGAITVPIHFWQPKK